MVNAHIKKILKPITWYILGMATPFVFFGVVDVLNMKTPMSKAEMLVSRWHISDCNNLLLVELKDSNGVTVGVSVEQDPKSGTLERASVIRDVQSKSDKNMVLSYVSKGKHGLPMTYCGSERSGSRLVWWDLNSDSRFDLRMDHRSAMMEINVGGEWIAGRGRDLVYTGDAVYRFDPNSGEWKQVDRNELPPEEQPPDRERQEQPFEEQNDFKRDFRHFRQETPDKDNAAQTS